MTSTLIIANTPGFWLGLVLMVVFALRLGWFPATGMYSMRAADKTVADLLHHMVLPAITTAAVSAAIIARLVRSSFLDVIRKGFVTALRAKGLSERDVILRHGLKNALPPIVNIIGLQVGYLMGGALFTEVVFSWPGIGPADLQLDRGARPAGRAGGGARDDVRLRAREPRHRRDRGRPRSTGAACVSKAMSVHERGLVETGQAEPLVAEAEMFRRPSEWRIFWEALSRDRLAVAAGGASCSSASWRRSRRC
jgi:hypothetical protein